MRVLGVDPGTLRMGYGLIDEVNGDVSMVECGILTLPQSVPLEKRLHRFYLELLDIMKSFQPEEVAVEEPFVALNIRSALALGRSQAVAIIAAIGCELPVFRYSPTQVKQQVTNYGRSSKSQVEAMVKVQLNLTDLPQPSDASDALALALCHLQQRRLKALISKAF